MAATAKRSKKPSAASSASQHELLVFFTDSSLGGKIIPGALRQIGETVERHDDHFPQGTKDEVWLEAVGRKKWVVLTKDTRIRYRATEINALLKHGARAFVLTARGDLKGEEMAQIFIKAMPGMKSMCTQLDPPFIANIARDSKITLIKGGKIK